MPTPTKGPRLGGSPSHQKAILANLATSLFEHGTITTTEAKARRLRPFAEKLISKAKRGDLHNRRQVLAVIRDKTVVHVLFTEIGPRYAERPGGYTRITKIGPRKGDNAPMAVIALVEEEFTARVRSTSARTASPSTTPSVVPAPAPAEHSEPVTEEPVADQEPAAEQEPAVEQEPAFEQEPAVEQEPAAETVGATAPATPGAVPDEGTPAGDGDSDPADPGATSQTDTGPVQPDADDVVAEDAAADDEDVRPDPKADEST